jgi:hypothetical protein
MTDHPNRSAESADEVSWVWVLDPILLDANEGGYEWWNDCLVRKSNEKDA